MRKKAYGRVTFATLPGNILDLVDCGETDVVYAWFRGAPAQVTNHVVKLFIKDKDTLFFVTNLRDVHKFDKVNVRLITHEPATFRGHPGQLMTMYIYGKRRYTGKRRACRRTVDRGGKRVVRPRPSAGGS